MLFLLAFALLGCSASARTINFITYEIVPNSTVKIGDTPVWDADKKLLFFADVVGGGIMCYNPSISEIKRVQLNCGEVRPVLPVAKTSDQFVVGCGGKLQLVTLNIANGQVTSTVPKDIKTLVEVDKGSSFTTGAVDPSGAIVVGVEDKDKKTASILRFQAAKDSKRGGEKFEKAIVLDRGYAVTGMDWSPNQKEFYTSDSASGKVYVYNFNKHTNAIANKKEFLNLGTLKLNGKPGGIMVDDARSLWIAGDGAGKFVRVDIKSKSIKESLNINTPYATSLTFGGTGLKDLYVTSANAWASKEELQKFPDSGDLFKFGDIVKGIGQDPRKAELVKSV